MCFEKENKISDGGMPPGGEGRGKGGGGIERGRVTSSEKYFDNLISLIQEASTSLEI